MGIKNKTVYLMNNTASTIVIGSITINVSESVSIWDTVNYINVSSNLNQLIINKSIVNEGVFNGDLLVIDGVSILQIQIAFDTLKELYQAYLSSISINNNWSISKATSNGIALEVLNNAKTISFFAEYNAGNSGVSLNIDFNNAQKQRVILTDNTTLTFTFPSVGNYILKLIQDGTGSRLPTVSSSVKSRDGSLKVKDTPNSITIWMIYYDGTNTNISHLTNLTTATVSLEV